VSLSNIQVGTLPPNIKALVHWPSFLAKTSAMVMVMDLTMPLLWPLWVVQHREDHFYLCRIAQGVKGKCSPMSLSLVLWSYTWPMEVLLKE